MARFAQSACGCGHNRAAHEHFRRGSDCGACGSRLCANFHAATPYPLVLARAVVKSLLPHRHAERQLASTR